MILTRWFDYGLMHPVSATYCFAHHYIEATKVFVATNHDIERADQAKALDHEDVFFSRDMTGMWLARRFADQHGLPYPVLLSFAQARCIKNYHRRFPRPNMLYSEELELDILDFWRDRLATQITYSRLPAVQAAAPATLLRGRHARFVIDQVRARHPDSHLGLLQRLFREGVLNEVMTRHDFHEDVIAQAAGACPA